MARIQPATLQYWMFTRPHRKLIRVPKSLAAFSSVALGRKWERNLLGQIEFEAELERNGLKAVGQHSERDRGRGGSGGRTHAALLYSLGLYFTWKERPGLDEEVYLTLAGQALVDQKDALPILRRQVLAHQFPSAYSAGVNMDARFRLRPFVLLLRLLRDPDLGGFLTDAEIAAAVIPFAEAHGPSDANRTKERVLQFRRSGLSALEPDFPQRLGIAGGAEDLRHAIYSVSGRLGAIANTATQWLRYTGFVQEASGAEFGVEAKTVMAINPNLILQVDEAVDYWGSVPLIPFSPLLNAPDAFSRHRAGAAFQRTYGRPPGTKKDSRQLGLLRNVSEKTRTTGLVAASLAHLFNTKPVLEITDEVVGAVVTHTGLNESIVRTTLSELIRTPQQGLSAFLDRYQQMAFAGRDLAIDFEKATAEIMSEVFHLTSSHVGQGGRVPDVVVSTNSWTGIIDTKAYASYDLPSDHQLRMQQSYVPKYQGQSPELRFFLYVAGGFASSINAKLSMIADQTGVTGSAIGVLPLITLAQGYAASGMEHDDLLALWSVGREITMLDVTSALAKLQ